MEPNRFGELWIIWTNSYKYSVKEEKQCSKDVLDIMREFLYDKIALDLKEQRNWNDSKEYILDQYCIPKKDWPQFNVLESIKAGEAMTASEDTKGTAGQREIS